MRVRFGSWLALVCAGWLAPLAAAERPPVNITPELRSVTVQHKGRPVRIERIQDPEHRIPDAFALTSRACPPHCVQPISLGGAVETVGELEVIEVMRRISDGARDLILVDTRPARFAREGTLPTAVNIPGDQFMVERGADPLTVSELLVQRFGVRDWEGLLDFTDAKTAVLFCYGIWCGQASRTIAALRRIGYPESRLKWYRGGVQAWVSLGLPLVEP